MGMTPEDRAAVVGIIAELDAKLDAPKSPPDPVTILEWVSVFRERVTLVKLLNEESAYSTE